ncbi:MAG: hypothetical protein ABID38_04640 [Candidatus Diapherotrites archaeon]
MPKNRKPQRNESSPGELYGKITVAMDDFEDGEKKLIKKAVHPFVSFCHGIYRRFPFFGNGGQFNKENKAAVEFLEWPLTGEEFAAASAFTLYASAIIAVIILFLIFLFTPIPQMVGEIAQGIPFLDLFYIFVPFLVAVFYLVNYVQTYPSNEAKQEQVRALTYVPEIVGYMIMSMKLVPNLEKAIEFSAEHGRGKIANDFRKMIWDTQLGVYSTLSEALDALAYRWGQFSEEFKRALMMVRASVIENTEAKRYAMLDNTMNEVLASIRSKMEQYARDLNQPAVMLFYLGVLLPLILIIVLPVGSAFSQAPMADPLILFAIYDVLIPLVTIAFAFKLISQRPPTYAPPQIPDDYPGLPPKWKMVIGKGLIDLRLIIAGVLIIGILGSVFLSTQGLPPRFIIGDDEPQLIKYDKSKEEVLNNKFNDPLYFELSEEGSLYRQLLARGVPADSIEDQVRYEEKIFFMRSENDIAPYNLVFGILLTLSLVIFFYFYYTNIYKKRVQEEVMQMESEFKESLYIIASRMGENKPIEEALKHVRNFLPNYKISDNLFGRILDNITLMGMPLEAAVFDPNYGALKDNPSSVIRGAMKLLVDSVSLGVNVAARSMISLSIQLTNADKVNKNLRVLVSDITGMMKTMSIFIAPIVLGITTSLQRIVIVTISQLASSNILENDLPIDSGGFSDVSLTSFFSVESFKSIATPTEFIIIVGIYILELVFIMVYFTSKIEEDNDLLFKVNFARFLPIAIAVFVITMMISNIVMGGFLFG